jgi:hypothetical protein
MFKLQPPAEPAWITVLPGVRVLFKPLGAVGLVVARTAVVRAEDDAGEGVRAHAYTAAAACWGGLDWEGVGDADGAPLAYSAANLAVLLEQNFDAYQAVDSLYVLPALLRDEEKNGSPPSLTGNSMAATTSAGPATPSATNAPQD